MIEIILFIVLVFMVIAAIVAIEIGDLLSSVIAIGAAGFGLAIVFLLLGAPDLAIVQVAIEILTLIMLLRVMVVREDDTRYNPYRSSTAIASAVALIAATLFVVIAWNCFSELPPFGSPFLTVSREYLQNAFANTKAPNLVTAILLDYRAYDTLGEATVIFTAIIGAMAILRKQGRAKDE